MILSTLRSLHFRWFPVFPLKTCAIDASPIVHKTVSMCPIDRSGAVAMIFVKLCYILSSSSSVLILSETTSQFEGLNFCCIRRSQSQSLLCEVKVSYILNWEGKSIWRLKIIFLWGCLPHGICYRMNAYIVSSRSRNPCYHRCKESKKNHHHHHVHSTHIYALLHGIVTYTI